MALENYQAREINVPIMRTKQDFWCFPTTKPQGLLADSRLSFLHFAIVALYRD